MMCLTLDTLLISDPYSGTDRTDEWEDQIDHRLGPKLKFPVKLKEESLGSLETSFKDPKITSPIKKKRNIDVKSKTVDIGKRNKDNKSKLF